MGHAWYMPHSYVWHESSILNGGRASFVCVTWVVDLKWGTCLIHMCDIRHRSRPPGLPSSLLTRHFLYHNGRTGFVPSKKRKRHASLICGTYVIYMCDKRLMSHITHMDEKDTSHWYVGHTLFICAIRLIHMCDMRHHMSHISMTRVFFIHMCDMRHQSLIAHIHNVCPTYQWLSSLCVGHDSFICVTWDINLDSYDVCGKSLVCGARIKSMWDMTRSYVWHETSISTATTSVASSFSAPSILQWEKRFFFLFPPPFENMEQANILKKSAWYSIYYIHWQLRK